MDELRPTIEVSELISNRSDCAAIYQMQCKLYDRDVKLNEAGHPLNISSDEDEEGHGKFFKLFNINMDISFFSAGLKKENCFVLRKERRIFWELQNTLNFYLEFLVRN